MTARRRLALTAVLVAAGTLTACGDAAPVVPDGAGPASPSTLPPRLRLDARTLGAPGPSGPAASRSPIAGRPAATSPGTPAPTRPARLDARACADHLVEGMTWPERTGQLVMVGVTQGGLDQARRAVTRDHVGSVFFIGGWEGRGPVRRASDALQGAARDGRQRTQLLVAADQEGGQVQQLRGDGFRRLPSALRQAELPPDELRALATDVGHDLAAAGVNLNLAPVADTVDPRMGRANGPIGRHDRGFATDPDQVSLPVAAVVTGLHAAGVGATLKHFPGLGRIRANTDHSATGIDDDRTTSHDAYLQPFVHGVEAGADVVMVATARYPRLDPGAQAAFSRRIVTGLLRGELGYDGVVATDDLGVAAAVTHIPAGERAVRFVRAGGDVAVTGRAADGAVMTRALLAEAARDPELRRLVDTAARRVVALKVRRGLAPCG